MNKKTQKAQMKIKQMAFMLIAVVIFFSMVGLFLISIRMGSYEDDVNILRQKNAALLASKLANSPEFSCGDAFGGQRSNCVDFDKVWILKRNIGNYKDFWGVTNIELKIIYSVQSYRQECTSQNFPKCGNIQIIDDSDIGYDVSSYVTVCRKEVLGDYEQDVCSLGKLFVRYEDVQT
jgi:hypothetical protein